MAKNVLIIVTGPPGAGKTTLASSLAELLGVPMFTKDAMKEVLFDSLGWEGREWSKKLGAASFELLYRMLEAQLKAGVPVLVEANFLGKTAEERVSRMVKDHGVFLVQVVCTAAEDVLRARVRERWAAGKRHPGHDDPADLKEKKPGWAKTGYGVLPLGGSVYKVDTTDFSKVDYGSLFTEIKLRVAAQRASADVPQV